MEPLRRPILNNGVAYAARSRNYTPAQNGLAHAPPSHNDTRSLNNTPAQERRAQLALQLRYRDIDRVVELPLAEGVLAWLMYEYRSAYGSVFELSIGEPPRTRPRQGP